MSDERRSQTFCDQEIQGSLMWRAIYYWCFGLFATGFFLFLWSAFVTMPEKSSLGITNELLRLFGPAVVGSLVILPLVVYDVFSQSNAFAGPVFRLRKALRSLAEGEQVGSIKLRDGDMLTDVVDDFNTLVERLSAAEGAVPVVQEVADDQDEQLVAMLADPVLAIAAEVSQAAHPSDDDTVSFAFPPGTFSEPQEASAGGYVG